MRLGFRCVVGKGSSGGGGGGGDGVCGQGLQRRGTVLVGADNGVEHRDADRGVVFPFLRPALLRWTGCCYSYGDALGGCGQWCAGESSFCGDEAWGCLLLFVWRVWWMGGCVFRDVIGVWERGRLGVVNAAIEDATFAAFGQIWDVSLGT